jgi:hypothetical protein
MNPKELAERRAKIHRQRVDKLVRAIARVEHALEDLGATPDLMPGADRLQDATDTLLTALNFVRAEQRKNGATNKTPKDNQLCDE